MSTKHPTPWTYDLSVLQDANKNPICVLATTDPETRAVLLHAMQLWYVLRNGLMFVRNSPLGQWIPQDFWELAEKIEAEIAKGKP